MITWVASGTNRDACHLADVRHSTAGPRVYLDHIHVVLAADDELDVDHTNDVEGLGQPSRVLGDLCLRPFRQALRRIDRDTVSGVDARTLDMLHDARNQDVCAVAYRVDLDLLALQVLVHQDRVILRDPVDDADELVDIIVIDGDLHALAAQHVGRTHEHRIAQAVRHFFGFLSGEYGAACRTRDLALFQDLIEELPVLRLVHVLRGCTEDRHAHLHQGFGQLDGRLSAELHHCAVRFLNVHDALHIFRCEGLEIQLVRDIKVRTYGFRIVVDDDRLVSFFSKCPCTVHGTEVKLDALADPDRAEPRTRTFFLPVVSSTSFSLPYTE